MSEETRNVAPASHAGREPVAKLQAQFSCVHRDLRRALLAIEDLLRSIDTIIFAEVRCTGPLEPARRVVRQRQKPTLSCKSQRCYRFDDEAYPEFERVIVSVMQGQAYKDEIYRTPSELHEVARVVGSFCSRSDNTESKPNQDRRVESAVLGRWCELHKGRTFTVKLDNQAVHVQFEAIGRGRQRKYRFTKLPK